MKLTQKLLSFLNRVFDKSPREFLALRLQYAGGMVWTVQDAVLSTVVAGGPGKNLSVDLTQYTVAQLATFLSAQTGYSVPYVDAGENSVLSARILIDATGDISASNGDHITGYTSVLWAYLEAVGSELKTAESALDEMLKQMSTRTASDVWLDEIGAMYGVPRYAAEADGSYGPRIIAEVIRPRTNNIAIAQAITAFTGQPTTVTDTFRFSGVAPLHNSAINYDGSHTYNSASQVQYGLFDVSYGYDLENGGSIAAFQSAVTSILGRLRAAGTQLNSLALTGSALADSFTAPTDAAAMPIVVAPSLSDTLTAPDDSLFASIASLPLADSLTPPGDGLSITISPNYTYNGLRLHDGSFQHLGASPVTETL